MALITIDQIVIHHVTDTGAKANASRGDLSNIVFINQRISNEVWAGPGSTEE